jgi:hypothetical protein
MLFYLCDSSSSKDIAPMHRFYPSVYSRIRKKVWRSGRLLACKIEDIGSRPGDVTFETIHFCRRCSTFVKFCRKSSIFLVKLSSGMPKTFSDIGLNWSCVTRCWCRTTSSTFFTVYVQYTVHIYIFFAPSSSYFWDIPALLNKFDICKRVWKKFDIYSKILSRDAGNFSDPRLH